MSLDSLTMNPSLLSAIVLMLVSLSIFIWWIVRKKRNRVWLPTLRLIKEESNPLPKMKLVVPPLLLFLCFFLSALTMLWLTTEPSQRQYRDISSNVNKIHIFIDRSPSTSAWDKPQQRVDFLRELFSYFVKQGSVSVGLSGVDDIRQFTDEAEFLSWVNSFGFHREGLKLGRGVHEQLEKVGSVDRLVILSDYDRYSWSDFNWRYLETKMEVIFASPQDRRDNRNVFINKASIKTSESDSQVVWQVQVSRNYTQGEVGGSLDVRVNDQKLTETTWRLLEEEKTVDIEVQWPASLWEGIAKQDDSMIWSLRTDGPNGITLDDQFRTKTEGLKRDILLVSEPDGEMFLEDAIHHLRISLEVLGFRIRRLDTFQIQEQFWNLPLWIVAADRGSVNDYCPAEFETRRLANQRANDLSVKESLPVVWLLPKNLDVSYRNLCWCYSRLVEGSQRQNELPRYCEEVETRDQYVSVLQSLGAQQIGGSVGDSLGALAWHRKRADSGVEVFAFTLPLSPSRRTGISYDLLPTLTKSFLTLSYLLNDKGERLNSDWPRIDDITGKTLQELRLPSNVPLGESTLTLEEAKNLPATWRQGGTLAIKSNPGVREEDDPRLWIEVAFWILAAAALLEGVWIGMRFVRGMGTKTSQAALIFLALWFSDEAHSSVKLNLAGYSWNNQIGETLARDVAGRTSISLDYELAVYPTITDQLFLEPWFWVRDAQVLSNPGHGGLESIKRWLKRGGFLVIEKSPGQDQLEKLIQIPGGVWKPIPPDHEIMRSFHLLDSLPKCQNQVWLGYHYDERIAVVAIPFGFLGGLLNTSSQDKCAAEIGRERATRIFINLLMVSLATDYKKDQIHLPEILKRLR
ncbi:DUF4159 domain-containing protein [Pseudobacteriovorax antillogorgiicola]|uniref:DUF4159 domain-containing protein n=1 Tax=Pseudobacteriovorax antillogorgiicola TaxID=1513793 RepID=A0A1Y6CH65_9BACT|nr:DUF4159 domain-containing protein [Pseudobacteriovorax antillogorgiicola]TCS48597.1 uncharacterized protein DUF4159 [Pseudobacteriovorax antillogorgiicola]SMF55612.1 protein of unknown function [Pseudobacteriovorax antillogorgiicola]